LEGVDEYDDDDDSDLSGSEEEDEEDWLGSSISRSSVGGHETREAPSVVDNSDANIVFEYDETQTSLQPPPTRPHEKKTILYIQMEYCTKRTLRQLIDDGIPDEEERWRLLRQVVEGLNHIHSQAIIHRDLKPSNIFLDAKGDVKVRVKFSTISLSITIFLHSLDW
jgi:translation initiation factor 2-alpha kinase 4